MLKTKVHKGEKGVGMDDLMIARLRRQSRKVRRQTPGERQGALMEFLHSLNDSRIDRFLLMQHEETLEGLIGACEELKCGKLKELAST